MHVKARLMLEYRATKQEPNIRALVMDARVRFLLLALLTCQSIVRDGNLMPRNDI